MVAVISSLLMLHSFLLGVFAVQFVLVSRCLSPSLRLCVQQTLTHSSPFRTYLPIVGCNNPHRLGWIIGQGDEIEVACADLALG